MPGDDMQLDDDAMRPAKAQAAERPLLTETRNGLRVVRLNPGSPKVTAELVDRLREALP